MLDSSSSPEIPGAPQDAPQNALQGLIIEDGPVSHLGSEPVYQGQFGSFTITAGDRWEVKVYRAGLGVAALAFGVAAALVLVQGRMGPVDSGWGDWVDGGYWLMWGALGVSLTLIHIYLVPLHRALQICWFGGGIASGAIALTQAYPLGQPLTGYVYEHPLTLLGVGWTFVALTGIFFKEAFCFNRLETKLLTLLVPLLLLGHLFGLLPIAVEQGLLATWAVLFGIFALRKATQAIPPDIGDKSVFEYLRSQASRSQP